MEAVRIFFLGGGGNRRSPPLAFSNRDFFHQNLKCYTYVLYRTTKVFENFRVFRKKRLNTEKVFFFRHRGVFRPSF